MRKEVRRSLYEFAGRVARGVSDRRRQRFILQMIVGLVIGGHVHLTKIARAIGSGVNSVHADEKRLSRHLDSQHWSMQPVMDGLLNDFGRDGRREIIDRGRSDRHRQVLRPTPGRFGMGARASDSEKQTASGYMLFEAYVRVRRRNAFINHPWRLPNKITYLFDWLATQISRFLHPKPKLLPTDSFNTE